MKKGKLILLILLLIAAFVCAKILYDQVMQSQIPDDPGIAQDVEPSPAPHEEEPQISYETVGTDEIAWNYDEFPDDYTFRNNKLLNEHYEKHGIEMGFASAEEYAAAANLVIHHPNTLHKIEKEDGDTCFYYEAANLFVVLSKDGYIRTFFAPDSGKKYYDKQ